MRRTITAFVVGAVFALGSCSSADEPQEQSAEIRVKAFQVVCWAGDINGGTARGCGSKTFPVLVNFDNISASIYKDTKKLNGYPLTIEIWKNGELVDFATTTARDGSVSVAIDD